MSRKSSMKIPDALKAIKKRIEKKPETFDMAHTHQMPYSPNAPDIIVSYDSLGEINRTTDRKLIAWDYGKHSMLGHYLLLLREKGFRPKMHESATDTLNRYFYYYGIEKYFPWVFSLKRWPKDLRELYKEDKVKGGVAAIDRFIKEGDYPDIDTSI